MNSIKNILKKNRWMVNIVHKYKILKFSNKYMNEFIHNYYDSKITQDKISYRILYVVHSLEKAYTNNKLRPFGIEKVKELYSLIMLYEKNNYDLSTYEYKIGISMLKKYLSTYYEYNWKKNEIVIELEKYFEQGKLKDINNIEIGARVLPLKNLLEGKEFQYGNFLKTRHSVRKYSNKIVEDNTIIKIIDECCCTPSACNRQMIKIYYPKTVEIKNVVTKYAMGKSCFDINNVNYLIVTFDISSLQFEGEMFQGWFNAGLMAMNIVNDMHSNGIGSCFIEFANNYDDEKDLKNVLNIPVNQKIAVLIAFGYYCDGTLNPISSRNDVDNILNIVKR